MEMFDVVMFTLWTLWCLTIPAYPIVQIIVLLKSVGMFRWIAAVPVAFMLPAYVLFALGISQGGDNNLSPLLLILPSPVALLYVVIVAIALFVQPAAKHSPPAA